MKINCKKGFTLIEVLVVVLIIGVLAAISLPMYTRSLEKARAVEAVQVLSDVAKSENAYFLAKHRYSSDFDDMVIQSFENASGSTHSTKFFDYELTLERITAERDLGDDSYTLYRVFGDPRTYCEPEDSKYCKIFKLESSVLGGGAAGSACEGEHIGYTCSVTHNADGTFTEHLCDGNNYCVTTTYSSKSEPLSSIQCYSYNEEGNCSLGKGKSYDENGRLISSFNCSDKEIDEKSGWCKNNGGQKYIYDDKGNIKALLSCEDEISSDGNCKTSGKATSYFYDKEGRLISEIDCYGSENIDSTTGNCSKANGGKVYLYDKNGKIAEGRCDTFNEDGTCSSGISKATLYNYKDGKLSYSIACQDYNSKDGKCSAYDTAYQEYDKNGNVTSKKYCTGGWDEDKEKCNEFDKGITTYNYDASGNKTSEKYCLDYAHDGTCIYYSMGNTQNVYNKDGLLVSEKSCSAYDSNKNCLEYKSGTAYAYDGNKVKIQGGCMAWNGEECAYFEKAELYNYNADGTVASKVTCVGYESSTGKCSKIDNAGTIYTYENGKVASERWCSDVNNEGTCNTTSGRVYKYDATGNLIARVDCKEFKDGTCQTYSNWGMVYAYDKGNKVAEYGCNSINSDGTCPSDGIDSKATVYEYDTNNNLTYSYACYDYDKGCTQVSSQREAYSYENGQEMGHSTCSYKDGVCTPNLTQQYSGSERLYNYDEHGNMTSSSYCSGYDSTGKCNGYQTDMSYQYTYDGQGNIMARTQDKGNGYYDICFYDTNYDGSQYIYNCETRSTDAAQASPTLLPGAIEAPEDVCKGKKCEDGYYLNKDCTCVKK